MFLKVDFWKIWTNHNLQFSTQNHFQLVEYYREVDVPQNNESYETLMNATVKTPENENYVNSKVGKAAGPHWVKHELQKLILTL